MVSIFLSSLQVIKIALLSSERLNLKNRTSLLIEVSGLAHTHKNKATVQILQPRAKLVIKWANRDNSEQKIHIS